MDDDLFAQVSGKWVSTNGGALCNALHICKRISRPCFLLVKTIGQQSCLPAWRGSLKQWKEFFKYIAIV